MVLLHPAPLPVQVVSTGRARSTKAGVRKAPASPGCYLFSDGEGAVLYVGKSVSLRTRLASYFATHRDRKTRAMVSHAEHVEWLTVGSEVEALILESQLVKCHQPPYNVQLKEQPHYTFLRLNDGGGYPYLEITGTVEADGAAYFGPFWGRRSAEQTLEFVNRLFSLRRCTSHLPSAVEGGACFYAQVHRCTAPCLSRVGRGQYAESIRSASELLRGDVVRLIERLEAERDAAAEGLRFEQAAQLHQIVQTLTTLQRKRRHLRSAASTVNFLMVVRRPDLEDVQVIAFSAARFRGQVTLSGSDDQQRRLLQLFIMEHYPVRRELEIDLAELDQMHVVAEWLARQGRQALYVPLPDGPLSMADAESAVASVLQAIFA
ncbi:MAG TPA: GIY-YIG nuclease family protein [Chloroflexota bacterium]|nr:GIY-YIG nuclease family protein [Chloroflexota bacterium]